MREAIALTQQPIKRPRSAVNARGPDTEDLAPMSDATIAAQRARVRTWRRDTRLKRLGFATYNDYIHSSTWANVRRRYRKSDRPQACVLCDSDERIVLHHLTYERVGDEALDDLVALCRTCHSYVHDLERSGYIESLDPQAIELLRNNRRAFENKSRQRKLRDQRTDHYEVINQREQEKRIRGCMIEMKAAIRRAAKEGMAIDELLEQVNAASKAMHAKISVIAQERKAA